MRLPLPLSLTLKAERLALRHDVLVDLLDPTPNPTPSPSPNPNPNPTPNAHLALRHDVVVDLLRVLLARLGCAAGEGEGAG